MKQNSVEFKVLIKKKKTYMRLKWFRFQLDKLRKKYFLKTLNININIMYSKIYNSKLLLEIIMRKIKVIHLAKYKKIKIWT